MSSLAAIADLLPDLVAVRHDLHAHPELNGTYFGRPAWPFF